jgi:transcription elongation GreA/GreB family factor
VTKAAKVIDKAALWAALIESVAEALAAARAAHAAAVEGATHSEARAENDKDTRGLEQSYLARGQAQRVAELEAAHAALTAAPVKRFAAGARIAAGALVELREDGVARTVLIAGHGGGTALPGGVQVVTPQAPLGRALLGRQVDDELELELGGRRRVIEIVAVA